MASQECSGRLVTDRMWGVRKGISQLYKVPCPVAGRMLTFWGGQEGDLMESFLVLI